MRLKIIYAATSGIAQALAQRWASQGYDLILLARDQERLQLLKQDLIVRGAKSVMVYSLDFLDRDSHRQIIKQIQEQHAGPYTLVWAQGTLFTQEELLVDFNKVDQLFQINTLSILSQIQNWLPTLSPLSQIAVITSVAGDRGRASNFIYASTKASLQAYLSGLRAFVFKRKIQVLDIRPGFVSTGMTAHLDQGPLFVKPDVVASDIDRALIKGKSQLYTPWFWFWIMQVIKNLPLVIFNRLKI